MTYQPPQEVLDKYAQLMIHFALGNTNGINKGDVVYVAVPEIAKPLLKSLYKTVLQAGGHPIVNLIPDLFEKEFFTYANGEQISHFHDKYYKGLIDQADHYLRVLADVDKKELQDISPKRIMARQLAHKPLMDWRNEKEHAGKLSWSLCMYATQAMADEAKLSLEDYWQEIIKACYLDTENPIQKWKETYEQIDHIQTELNKLEIDSLHIKSQNTDLYVKIGPKRKWLSGRGCNIPSFEIYISPDWRGTNGYIQFTEPLYRYGTFITNAYLEFKDGLVVKATAQTGEEQLQEMIAAKNADKIGEFSLTDGRFSKITKFMAETLFDENIGGKYGNTHIAIGMAYKDSYTGDIQSLTQKDWEDLGFNDSSVHTDIVSTENRIVTATLSDGSQKIIYRDGQFQL